MTRANGRYRVYNLNTFAAIRSVRQRTVTLGAFRHFTSSDQSYSEFGKVADQDRDGRQERREPAGRIDRQMYGLLPHVLCRLSGEMHPVTESVLQLLISLLSTWTASSELCRIEGQQGRIDRARQQLDVAPILSAGIGADP
jgi:hypothetical protein